MQKPWTVEVVRCTKEWANGAPTTQRINASMVELFSKSQWIKEPTNQLTTESRMQWINFNDSKIQNEPMNRQFFVNDSMTQWITEPMKNWIDETMNQRITESRKQWTNGFNGSTIQWVNEPVNQRRKESLNHRIKKPKPVLYDFDVQIELSVQSREHFSDHIFQTFSEHY